MNKSWMPALSMLGLLLLAAVLGGCDRQQKVEGPLGAKVNDVAVTIEQIEFVAKRSGPVTPEVQKELKRRALEQVINQQLLVQQAEAEKLAQDPKIANAIDNARRQVLAKAWLDKVAAALPKPTDADIAKFYDENPGLFAQRRIYRLLQIAVPGDVAFRATLEAKLKALNANPDKSALMKGLAIWLQSQNINFRPNSATQTAEQLPLELVNRFAQMKDGDSMLLPVEGGYQVLQIAASHLQPMDRDKGRPIIEQYLSNRVRAEASQNELKRLRAAAKIEYLGDYQKAAADGSGGAQHGLPDAPADDGVAGESGNGKASAPSAGETGKP